MLLSGTPVVGWPKMRTWTRIGHRGAGDQVDDQRTRAGVDASLRHPVHRRRSLARRCGVAQAVEVPARRRWISSYRRCLGHRRFSDVGLEALQIPAGAARHPRRAVPARRQLRRRASPHCRTLRDLSPSPAGRSARCAYRERRRAAVPHLDGRQAPARSARSIRESAAVISGCARNAVPPATWTASITVVRPACGGVGQKTWALPRLSRRAKGVGAHRPPALKPLKASAIARPADEPRAAGSGRRRSAFRRRPSRSRLSEPLADFSDTAASDPRASTLRDSCEDRAAGIDDRTEHVDVVLVFELVTISIPAINRVRVRSSGVDSFGEPTHCVVIRHCDDGQPCRRRSSNEAGRAQQSIRCGRVQVEVDHRCRNPGRAAPERGKRSSDCVRTAGVAPRRAGLRRRSSRGVLANQQLKVFAFFGGETRKICLPSDLRSGRRSA